MATTAADVRIANPSPGNTIQPAWYELVDRPSWSNISELQFKKRTARETHYICPDCSDHILVRVIGKITVWSCMGVCRPFHGQKRRGGYLDEYGNRLTKGTDAPTFEWAVPTLTSKTYTEAFPYADSIEDRAYKTAQAGYRFFIPEEQIRGHLMDHFPGLDVEPIISHARGADFARRAHGEDYALVAATREAIQQSSMSTSTKAAMDYLLSTFLSHGKARPVERTATVTVRPTVKLAGYLIKDFMEWRGAVGEREFKRFRKELRAYGITSRKRQHRSRQCWTWHIDFLDLLHILGEHSERPAPLSTATSYLVASERVDEVVHPSTPSQRGPPGSTYIRRTAQQRANDHLTELDQAVARYERWRAAHPDDDVPTRTYTCITYGEECVDVSFRDQCWLCGGASCAPRWSWEMLAS